MKPIVTIRGNRILVTPSNDAQLPEGERRVFAFLNPSVRTYDRVIADAQADAAADAQATPDQPSTMTRRLVHRLLRGWENVTTEDAAVAAAYKAEPAAGGVAVPLPYPAADGEKRPDLLDVVSIADWREIRDGVIEAANPSLSGN